MEGHTVGGDSTPDSSALSPRHTHLKISDPSRFGTAERTQCHGLCNATVPCGQFPRGNRLTKCAGDGDLVSLTVVLEGTSRRGHFICRYCTGHRKHKIAGEMGSH